MRIVHQNEFHVKWKKKISVFTPQFSLFHGPYGSASVCIYRKNSFFCLQFASFHFFRFPVLFLLFVFHSIFFVFSLCHSFARHVIHLWLCTSGQIALGNMQYYTMHILSSIFHAHFAWKMKPIVYVRMSERKERK